MNELSELIKNHLADWQSGWSMGSFGALAEFHQDEGEALTIDVPNGLARATDRGGIRFDVARMANVRAVAYETLSPRRHRWSQAIELCLPTEEAKGHSRAVLTELGPDAEAIRDGDRAGILFDMGLALPQCDFCIRTADGELLDILRANEGRSIFDTANSAMPAILRHHPHRIAITAIGRIEVYQKIGGPDTGGVSPPGPHTHLLPKLLQSGRTHSANTPIPEGLMPLGAMHPGNPVIGPLGEERDFDQQLFNDFQSLLVRYGDPEIVALKARVAAALRADDDAETIDVPDGRFARVALKLTLRQHARLAKETSDGALAKTVNRWQQTHEKTLEPETEEDEAPGH